MNPDIKKKTTWKNTYFARYMLLRYSLALFFFANLYWFIVLVYQRQVFSVIPFTTLLLHILGSVEQFKLYGRREVVLKMTKKAFQIQTIMNVIVIGISLSPLFSLLFPVFSDNTLGRGFVIALQVLGFGIININLNRIVQILENKDKFYYRFQSKIEKYI